MNYQKNIKNKILFKIHEKITHGYNTKPNQATNDDDVKLYYNGSIHNMDPADLLKLYLLDGVSFVKKLKGSFLFFIIDTRENCKQKFYLITDFVNSRKAFIYKNNEEIFVSNDIELIPKEKCTISEKGIACYITNGNMLNGITLYNEIKICDSASIYTIENGFIKQEKYWNINIDYSTYNSSSKKLYKNKLKKILLNSLRENIINIKGNILVSLSAGYDARSIAGILSKKLNFQDITTFTYHPEEKPKSNSDVALSKKIASYLGCNHISLQSYQGNFIDLLVKNAVYGKCIAYFCDELHALEKIKEMKQFNHVFVGDEWFGRLDVPLKNEAEILDSVSIVGEQGLNWLKKVFNQSKYNELKNVLKQLTKEILESSKEFKNPHDKKDFLYLTQRISYVNMSWREFFTSKIGMVHNPYLDTEIITFFSKMPPDLRIEKKFFIEVIKEFLPDLFKIPIANDRASLTGINLKSEFRLHKKEIEIILQKDSRLEDFISREEIRYALSLLEREGKSYLSKFLLRIKKMINFLRRKSKILDAIFYPILGARAVKGPSSEKLILRMLLLWIYLFEDPIKGKTE